MGEFSRHVELEVQRFPFPPTDWAPPCNEFSRGAFFVDALMAASEGPPMSADEICALLAADETWRECTLGEAA